MNFSWLLIVLSFKTSVHEAGAVPFRQLRKNTRKKETNSEVVAPGQRCPNGSETHLPIPAPLEVEQQHHPKGNPIDRYTIYYDELLVITPHKAGSRYVTHSFATIYNCTLKNFPGCEVRTCMPYGAKSKFDAMLKKKSRNHHYLNEHFRISIESGELFVVITLRDPIERAISMYNHFCTESKFPSVQPPLICAKSCKWNNALGHEYDEDRKRIPSIQIRLLRFVRWTECMIKKKSFSTLLKRHFTPASEYNLVDEARIFGRTEDLGSLINNLTHRLPILETKMRKDPPSIMHFDTITPTTNVMKDDTFRDSARRNRWAMYMCFMSLEAKEKIWKIYKKDYITFNGVF